MRDIETISPENISGKSMVERLSATISEKGNITVMTDSQVKASSGNIGDFRLSIEDKGGYVNEIKVGSILVSTGFET